MHLIDILVFVYIYLRVTFLVALLLTGPEGEYLHHQLNEGRGMEGGGTKQTFFILGSHKTFCVLEFLWK